MSADTTETTAMANSVLKIFVILLKMMFAVPAFFICAGASIITVADTAMIIYAFLSSDVFPAAFIMYNICFTMIFISLTFLLLKVLFSKKLAKISAGKAGGVAAVFFVGAIAFNIVNMNQTDRWEWAEYPAYIEQWDTQVLYRTRDCDYSLDRIYFEGYFDFIDYGFRENAVVQTVQDDSLTDKYRIEVYYKGEKSELYIFTDDDTENISVYTVDYDYDLSPQDYVYMYENRVNLEYSTPLAIEKIIIRTAYPEKIDISGIEA